MKFCKFFIILIYFKVINSFIVNYPTFTKNKAIISNIDVKKITTDDKLELQHLFNIVPMLVFKNQKINPQEYYDFCKIFDKNYKKDILHPWYTGIPSVPQVSIRGNMNTSGLFGTDNVYIGDKQDRTNYFRYNYVWHQDLTGHNKYLPPILSSMYTLKTPNKNKISTIYASLEDAYDSLDLSLKMMLKNYNAINVNSLDRLKGITYDYTGFVRKDKKLYYDDDIFVKDPLIIYSDKTKYRKSILINPNRFFKFDKLDYDDSLELYRHIMKNHVLNKRNIFIHNWDENDLVIWNNRKLIHTSSPGIEHTNKHYNRDRLFIQCFLATKEPLLSSSKNSEPIFNPINIDKKDIIQDTFEDLESHI
tara:strand:+ start:2750 stop:3835 length:1086 start_codon:yes stop_codon:yes gene_type:complete